MHSLLPCLARYLQEEQKKQRNGSQSTSCERMHRMEAQKTNAAIVNRQLIGRQQLAAQQQAARPLFSYCTCATVGLGLLVGRSFVLFCLCFCFFGSDLVIGNCSATTSASTLLRLKLLLLLVLMQSTRNQERWDDDSTTSKGTNLS